MVEESFKCPKCGATLTVAVTASPEHTPRSDVDKLADIVGMFPEEQQLVLDFIDKGDYVEVKPKNYLGSDMFAKVGAVVRGLGGEYLSMGKESHFRVKKSKE